MWCRPLSFPIRQYWWALFSGCQVSYGWHRLPILLFMKKQTDGNNNRMSVNEGDFTSFVKSPFLQDMSKLQYAKHIGDVFSYYSVIDVPCFFFINGCIYTECSCQSCFRLLNMISSTHSSVINESDNHAFHDFLTSSALTEMKIWAVCHLNVLGPFVVVPS